MSGNLIAVWAPCSGSGVTTLCASLGSAMASSGAVLALDLNVTEPSLSLRALRPGLVHTHLDSLLPVLRGRRLTPDELEPYITPVPGVLVGGALAGFLHPFSAMQMNESDVQALLDCATAGMSVVLADLNPTLDSVATWPVLERADKVVWVVGGSYESRYHTRRYLSLREQLGLTPDRVHLTYVATHPVPVEQVAEEIGAVPDSVIPSVPSLRDHEGHIQLSRLPSAYRKAVQQLAQALDARVKDRVAASSQRWFGSRRDARAKR